MTKLRILRIATVSMSYRLLLKGQLGYMSKYFETHAASSPGWELDDLEKDEHTKTYPIPMERVPAPLKDLTSLLKLRTLIKKVRPQIVHTHTPKAGLLGMMASYWMKVPVRLHTVAGIPWMESSGQKRKLLKFMERLTYSCATHVYSNSMAMRDFILNNKLATPDKVSVIGNGSSNGIDTAWYSLTEEVKSEAQAISEKYQLQHSKVIIFVGRLVKDKGIEELLEAYSKLKQEGFSIKLLLVGPYERGRDPLSAEAEQMIEEDVDIITTGYVKDVRPFMAASSILAFPSYREGFPNVPMQAGSLGLPSVVTDINGCNEIVKEGVNGLIIPPKSAAALHHALRNLLSDETLYATLAAQAREMISARYDQQLLWEALLSEYRLHLNKAGIDV